MCVRMYYVRLSFCIDVCLHQGVLCARGESILMVDADGATEFKDLDRLEKALGKDATDWVRQ